MTSVEKRRSGRKSGGHRKHSDGGYSDTSSGGSFLDENDREVSSLTDRAFRSLCIGDEAVYNDSDLSLSSPCTQRDRQLAFSQGGQDRDRDELKRTAHENFSLRVQQYGQDWIHGGMYAAEIHRDPQWEVYGERTQGRVSATFQHSFVETSQQEKSLREEQLSFLSNGATDLNSQQLRSRSRVSSLIRAFNSEGHRDVTGMDDKPREWNDEMSWDKSALMSIQRELSEFSTSYQQNFNSGHFTTAGSFSSQDASFYSSDVAAVGHMSHNSAASFMRSSHSKHSMSAQVNCNSNFFIHSEFSPFKVWRDHNRFPFQQGQVSGFMHRSEFPKWYETPMYKELSVQGQLQDPYRGFRHGNLAPVFPPSPPRSTSTSTMLQKASSVEKRCESELAGHFPHRKRTQSLGTNRLQSHRPSTASPTIEMSRRVRDTISSVKALQQKLKMMTDQNITTGVIENQQGEVYSNDNLILIGNNAVTIAPNVVSSNTSTTPFNISQLLTPLVHAQQEAETSDFQQYEAPLEPVEHPPVRAESRGATPDVRMSSYKSRATSLLFNLKDNRKRVKSTYSPTKFKGLETQEKNKQPSVQERRETVIDMPDSLDANIQYPQLEESSRMNPVGHQYVNQYQNPALSRSKLNPYPATVHTGQYPHYTLSDYQTAQMQGQMVHHSGFTDFIPENYTSNQLANGQNLHENLASFAPYKQGVIDNVGTLGGDVYKHKPSYTATETPRLNAESNQNREYLISKANTEQPFNETVGRVFTMVDRYEQLKHSKHDYDNASSLDKGRQTNSQDIEKLSQKVHPSPWKQETAALMEKTRQEKQPNINKDLEKVELRESFGIGTSFHNISNQLPQGSFSNDTVENPAYYGQQQPLAFQGKNVLQKYSGHNVNSEMKDNYLLQNYNRHTDQDYRSQPANYSSKDKPMAMQETGQTKQYTPITKGNEIQSLQPIDAKPQLEDNIVINSLPKPDNTSAHAMTNQIKDGHFVEVKAEEVVAEHITAEHVQAELAKAQQWAHEEQSKAESASLILAGQTGSEKVRTEQAKTELTQQERVKQATAEHRKNKKIEEQTEQASKTQPEWVIEEHTKAEKTREQKVTDEPRNITEEAGAEHMREEQGQPVKAEQVETERLKEEHINAKLAKTKQVAEARIKQTQCEQATGKIIYSEPVWEEQVSIKKEQTEQTRTEQIKEQQTKVEQVQARVAEVGKVNTDHIKNKDVKQVKDDEDSVPQVRVHAEQPTMQESAAKETNVEERKAEQVKLDRFKVELTKTESMQERSAKLTAKLAATQVKSEPDKVEQVKTELAKAKAELAKIKEKMRGEQKEKARNTAIIREEDTAKNNVPSRLSIDKSEDSKKQDQAAQVHQQKEDSAVRNGSWQPDRGADEYNRLREKYGFLNAVSAGRNEVPATESVSSNDNNETQDLSVDKVETVNTKKSGDDCSPINRFTTANMENREKGGIFKSSEVIESQYVYSESSKEFKLSSSNYPPTKVDKGENSDSVTGKVKDDNIQKLGKCDPAKHTHVALQKDSDLTKLPPPERKPKSTDHTAGPAKDLHFTPPKALSHKERAQTKQEILTSKIKAHAEKEISAIKEKGFAVRDGVKNSAKQLAGSQSLNIRQRPASQDVSKKNESKISSNVTPKHQREASGVQLESVTSVSPPSAATIPAKPSATTTQSVDHLQKQTPQKPMKSNSDVPEQPRKTKQTGSYTISTTEGLVQNQNQENQPEIKSPLQNKEQALKIEQEKQDVNHGEVAGKQKEELKGNPAVHTDILDRKKEDPPGAKSDEAATEKAESKEATHKDSAASLNLVLGQKEAPVVDDSLQIMGIIVTVRERMASVDSGQGNNCTKKLMDETENESSNLELDKCHPISGFEVSEKITTSKGDDTVKEKAIQETYCAETEDLAKVGKNPENVQETSTLETRKNNMKGNVMEKRTKLKQEDSSMNAKSQKEIQPQPLTEKGVPFTVTVPAKNKVLAETQSLLYKQGYTIAKETKDYPENNTGGDEVKTEEKNPQNIQTVHTIENLIPKVENAGINNKNNAETLIKHGVQPSLKEDMTTVINQCKTSNRDDKSAPLLEEKRHDSTPPKAFNKASPNNLSENESRHASPEHQSNETHIEEINQVDDEVHIDSIAIRIVPAVTKQDNVKMVEKHHVKNSPSDVVLSNEHKQVTSSSCGEKANTFKNEDTSKDLTPASREKVTKDSLDGVQSVLSSVRKVSDSVKISNQQSSKNATCENTQAENGKPENGQKSEKLIIDSSIEPVEGDYFQVQGMTETTNEPHNKSATVGDTSKGTELPRLQPNKTAFGSESYKEEKNEALVFSVDQDKSKAVESSSVSSHDESEKRKNWEIEDKLASKQTDGSMERCSNNEKMEAGQVNHTKKHPTENESSLSAMQRQSSRNSHTTRESKINDNAKVKPKPKERVSTIPEISALADYARLKVIVSEDRDVNPIQEFPPNKKEGFFPLIHTRHSRRPVFTVDPQEPSVKEKTLPNKTEMSAKVNKEPKALVFPITEKEHQRTGMFKLGDKERQEKMLLEAKVNEGVLDSAAKYAHHKEIYNSPTALTEGMIGAGTQRVNQVDQTSCQLKNSPLQATTASCAVNRPRNPSEGLTYLDKISPPHPIMEQMHNREENKTTPSTNESIEKQGKGPGAKTEDGRPNKLKSKSPTTQHEEIKAKHHGKIKQLEEERALRSKEERREEDMRIKHMIEERRTSLAEEERRAIQREEEKRAREHEAIAIKIKERQEKQREAERRAEEERKAQQKEEAKAAQKEEEMRAKQREEEMRMKQIEENRKIKIEEEKQAKLAEEEEQRKEDEEKSRVKKQEERAAQEKQQKRKVHKEQQRRAAHEEQQRRAVQEQQRRAEKEEQQRRAVQEQQRQAEKEEQQRRVAREQQKQAEQEQQRRAAQEEQQRRAVQEEQQRRAVQEEQQRRAVQEEQQRRAVQEEQQRRAVQEEQQRRAVQEEQQRRAAQEEQQRRAVQEEQQRRAAQEEQQRKAAQEQQRRAVQEEQQRRAVQEEQQRKAAQEQQRRAVQEEQQRRAVQEEQQRKAAQEQQKRAAQEEQQRATQEQQRRAAEEQQRGAQGELQRRAIQEEKQKRAAQEKQQRAAQELQRIAAEDKQQRQAGTEVQQRRGALIEEQWQAKLTQDRILGDIEEENKRKLQEKNKTAHCPEERIKHIQEKKAEQQTEEQMSERQKKEEWLRTQRGKEEKRAVEKEKVINPREEYLVKEQRARLFEESHTALTEERKIAQEQMPVQRQDEIQAKKREEDEEKLAAHREKMTAAQLEKQKRAAQMDALQYYAITSTEPERKPRERQLLSPLLSQQRNNTSGLDPTDRPCRPHAPASPAPSLPRSNTSSPALGVKPSMFRVKDNTIRSSSFTKSVKPRFHKNFAEDFRGGLPMNRGSEKGEEEQEMMRSSAGTPIHPDTGVNRLPAINESSTHHSASSSQGYSAPISYHRPYSRRSFTVDEDDSRSVISTMSEDVESFATSAVDPADVRGLYEYDRPESACSFSSDVSRALGKPPSVPPKSEKALRRAQRLTSRRIKKELSKVAENSPAGAEKDAPIITSSSTEVCPSKRHAVASPHCSPPVSLTHAPALGSSLSPPRAEHQTSHRSFHASPHTTGPISLPISSAHAAATASAPAALKTVAHVPSSPTLHHANHPAPVTQYHLESSYPQSYPLTQRKVLQDLGSGQYFVVDVPVQVKTKTFIDPETGKYVQLNVRESGQSISRPQPQQTCPQPQLQPQMQIKPQQQPLPQASPSGKPVMFYQGYHGYTQGYHPAAINSLHPNSSSDPATHQQNQQPVRDSHSYPALEPGQNSDGHHYSPEKTPYMDTVNDIDKTYNTVYDTHGSYESFPECDTNSQLAGRSVCENESSAHSQYQPRDIITMSELEDFMEVSDW